MLPTAASGRPPRTPFLDNFLLADHTSTGRRVLPPRLESDPGSFAAETNRISKRLTCFETFPAGLC